MSEPNTNVTGTPPEPAKPAVTATPTKPAAPAKKGPGRRSFLVAVFASWVGIAWTTMTAALGLMMLGTVRFMFPNVLSEPPSKFKVGLPESFEEGKVIERFKDQNAWVVRHEGQIFALSTTCTHLGCTPNWLEREAKFKCPCHGSGFYITGINFEGPAPRPLERWALFVGEDGQVVVDKSRKFQYERGEWTNPDSFIKV